METFSVLLAICAGNSPVTREFPAQWRGVLMFSFDLAWTNGWVKNREAGDLRRHRAYYDATLMSVSVKEPLGVRRNNPFGWHIANLPHCVWWKEISTQRSSFWAPSQYKDRTSYLRMAISMLKIRRPLGRLIFNMGIAIPGKTAFLIETAPWFSNYGA